MERCVEALWHTNRLSMKRTGACTLASPRCTMTINRTAAWDTRNTLEIADSDVQAQVCVAHRQSQNLLRSNCLATPFPLRSLMPMPLGSRLSVEVRIEQNRRGTSDT